MMIPHHILIQLYIKLMVGNYVFEDEIIEYNMINTFLCDII